MSSEPDSQIERQLRGYAERRRRAAKDEEFKLHPVTRNSLKVEIVRQYGRRLPGAREEKSIWSQLWPRLAVTGGGVFILIVAFLIFRPASQKSTDREIAFAEGIDVPNSTPSSAREEATPLADSGPVPAQPGEIQTSKAAPRPSTELVYQFYAVASAGAQEPPPPSARNQRSIAPLKTDLTKTSPAQATPDLPGPTSPVAAAGILVSFQFRVDGDRVTVIDKDQSVYSGRIQPINPETLPGAAATFDPSMLGDSSDPNFPRNYRLYSEQGGRSGAPAAGQFSVHGTNVTSGRQTSFSGRMLTWIQTEPLTSTSNALEPKSVIQIRGTADVAGEPSLSVHATTSPQ